MIRSHVSFTAQDFDAVSLLKVEFFVLGTHSQLAFSIVLSYCPWAVDTERLRRVELCLPVEIRIFTD